MKIREYVFN